MQRFSVFVFVCFLFVGPLGAQEARLSPEKYILAEKLRSYLNEMKTLSSGFVQISSTGDYADGKVYLSRPGKMRLTYNPPLQSEIVVRKGTIIYHDKEFKQVTYYPLNATPLAVLLDEDISFEKDVRLLDIAQGSGVIEMTLTDREDAGVGSVTLVFSDRPLALRKWSVTDAQGTVTTVSLLNPILGAKINPTLFDFVDPQYDQQNN